MSLTLVYCGQAVGWIKMRLGAEEGLGPGNIALDGKPATPMERDTLFAHVPKWSPISVSFNVYHIKGQRNK